MILKFPRLYSLRDKTHRYQVRFVLNNYCALRSGVLQNVDVSHSHVTLPRDLAMKT